MAARKPPASEDAAPGLPVPELGLHVPLPAWFLETEAELQKPVPEWPLVEAARAPVSPSAAAAAAAAPPSPVAAPAAQPLVPSGAGEEVAQSVQTGVEPLERKQGSPARRKLFTAVVAVLFAVGAERSALLFLTQLAARHRAQLQDACQFQLQSCVSWLKRSLRVFCRTLMADSHAGLVLMASGDDARPHRGLSAERHLAIRAEVIFDLLEAEGDGPPPALRKFLAQLAPQGHAGSVLYLPETYLTLTEQMLLPQDSRGGIEVLPGSPSHELLAAGFVVLRALLVGLFASWVRALGPQSGAGARRGRQNLQAIAQLICAAMASHYGNIAQASEVPGLADAIGSSDVGDSAIAAGNQGVVAHIALRLQHLVRWLLGFEQSWAIRVPELPATPPPGGRAASGSAAAAAAAAAAASAEPGLPGAIADGEGEPGGAAAADAALPLADAGAPPLAPPLAAPEAAAAEPRSEDGAPGGDVQPGDRAQDAPPEGFIVTIDKNGNGKLGVQVQHALTDDFLCIKKVKGGLIQDWNDDNPSMQVQPNDEIVSVNDIAGDSSKMMQAIAEHPVLRMQIRRPKPEEQ